MDYLNYDPVGPEIIEDPIPAYSDLREMCPVHYHEGLENPIYSFSRYADVQSVLLDLVSNLIYIIAMILMKSRQE